MHRHIYIHRDIYMQLTVASKDEDARAGELFMQYIYTYIYINI